jgi:hypothetical protein
MEQVSLSSLIHRNTRTPKVVSWRKEMVDDEVFEDYLRTLDERDEVDDEGNFLECVYFVSRVSHINLNCLEIFEKPEKVKSKKKKSQRKSEEVLENESLNSFLEENGWGSQKFKGLEDQIFSFPVGPKMDILGECDTIGKIFDLMWTSISTHIVEETERRESLGFQIEDINLFLASQLVMGLTPQPSIVDYFTHDKRGIFGSSWMQQHFTQSKWSHMHSHIHFDSHYCIGQVRVNSQRLWNLDQILVVDEMMVPFCGRWKWIQFVKGKPHDTGLKFYCLADRNGYLWDFWLYQGTESERSGKPADIVMDFVFNALREQHKPHIIVADSFYGGLKLAEALHEKKLGCLFSCKSDRPSYLFSKCLHNDLAKGEFQYINNRNFSAMTYYDKSKVNLVTNLFAIHKLTQNSNQSKSLPLGLYWYRKWLGAVDHFDRSLHLYLQGHRNLKWTQALLPALLKIAIGNTNTIAMHMGFDTTLKQTTLQIIDHLTGSHTMRRDENRPTYAKRKQEWGHFPEKLDKKIKCVECQSNSKNSNTGYKCRQCDVPLHPHCFVDYHEK